MIRRLGLIGDVHAEDERLERALDVLRARGVDAVASTGDIVDGKGSVDRCCELLETHGVLMAFGNHDRWFLSGAARYLPDATEPSVVSRRSRAFLGRIPRTVELDVVGGLALLCHGLGHNDMAKVDPQDYGYAIDSNLELQTLVQGERYRWILNGHSHRPMVRSFGGLTVINAGTLKREHSPCFLEVDFQTAAVLIFRFDDDGVIETAPLHVRVDGPR